MVKLGIVLAFCLSVYTTGVATAPTNSTEENNLPYSIDDILNTPAVLAPLVDPKFAPVDGGSNATLIAADPQFAAPVKNLPSIKSSISAALAAPTGAVSVATGSPPPKPTAGSPTRRELAQRTAPAGPPEGDPTKIDCLNLGYPEVSYAFWKAAINKACHKFFDASPSLVYLLEGSTQSVTVGVPSRPYHFEYHVRPVPCTKYWNWVFYSIDICIADLEGRMYAAINPDVPANGECWDSSGMSSEPDDTLAVWYKISSPDH